jgi:hypothetical protein
MYTGKEQRKAAIAIKDLISAIRRDDSDFEFRR